MGKKSKVKKRQKPDFDDIGVIQEDPLLSTTTGSSPDPQATPLPSENRSSSSDHSSSTSKQKKTKKNKKKKKKFDLDESLDFETDANKAPVNETFSEIQTQNSLTESTSSSTSSDVSLPQKKKKKKKKKNKYFDLDDALDFEETPQNIENTQSSTQSIDQSPVDDSITSSKVSSPPVKPKKKKKKKKNKAFDLDDELDILTESTPSTSQSLDSEPAISAQNPQESPSTDVLDSSTSKKKKKKNKKNKKSIGFDLDEELALLDGSEQESLPQDSVVDDSVSSSPQIKKKKKKKKKTQVDHDAEMDFVNSLPDVPVEKTPSDASTNDLSSSSPQTSDPPPQTSDAPSDTPTNPSTLDSSSDPKSKKKKKNKKLSKQQKALAKLKAKQDSRKQAQLEEQQRIDAANALIAKQAAEKEALEKQKLADLEAKKAKEAARIAELKKAGLYVSKSERKRRAQQKRRAAELLENSDINVEKIGSKRVFKKKKKNKKSARTQAAAFASATTLHDTTTNVDGIKTDSVVSTESHSLSTDQQDVEKSHPKPPKHPIPEIEDKVSKMDALSLVDNSDSDLDWENSSGDDDDDNGDNNANENDSVSVDPNVKSNQPKLPLEVESVPLSTPIEFKSTGEEPSTATTTSSVSTLAPAKKNSSKYSVGTTLAQSLADENFSDSSDDEDDQLRSPILCILGHVNHGKTKILDYIRESSVQEGEWGGITQQIGATFFPMSAILKKTAEITANNTRIHMDLPGLLVIDTPGHESFANLRSRGSSMCDIAILVVNIMEGIKQQTLESIALLQLRKTPYVIALNKVDLLYEWKSEPNAPFRTSYAKQPKGAVENFQNRLKQIKYEFQTQGYNTELYYQNKSKNVVNIIPCSAITGEGIPDLLTLIVQLSQKYIAHRLENQNDEFTATVLEVKKDPGLGPIIDVILANGKLRKNDKLILCGAAGPIHTQIRALVTPQPLKEIRVRSPYIHHEVIRAAMGCRIAGNGLKDVVAGSSIMVVPEDADEEEIEELENIVMADVKKLLAFYNTQTASHGIHVQSSTLGSLEALLSLLNAAKVPISSVSVGPIHRKDVSKAASQHVLENHHLAVILAFECQISPNVLAFAKQEKVVIFNEPSVYSLLPKFEKHILDIEEAKRQEMLPKAVFPALVKILPNHIFNARSPLICGIEVLEGVLRVGTPLVTKRKGKLPIVEDPNDPVYQADLVKGAVLPPQFVSLGKVVNIKVDGKDIDVCHQGKQCSVRINCSLEPGRQYEEEAIMFSKISRASVDILKEYFKPWMKPHLWQLIIKLQLELGQRTKKAKIKSIKPVVSSKSSSKLKPKSSK